MKERPLRIFFVTSGGTASKGGMGRMALYLTQEMRSNHPTIRVRIFDSYGPGHTAFMPFYFLWCCLSIGTLSLFRRPDVIHLNLAAHGSTARKLILMWLARLFGVATLLHIHASKFIPFCESLGPRSRRMLIGSLSRASCIVVIGDFWRRYLVEQLGVPRSLVTVIHNAVPMPTDVGSRGSRVRCRIVALGLLGPRKGTPELLDALASPNMRELDWDAIIAGNGTVDESRQRVAELKLTDRVEIPGWVGGEAVSRILASADVLTLPSHNEGLPVSILEAMSAGLPVVTTPVGAIPELVIDGETGILVQPGSSTELAEALGELISNPSMRMQLGANARKRVETFFRIEVTTQRFVDIYQRLSKPREVSQ